MFLFIWIIQAQFIDNFKHEYRCERSLLTGVCFSHVLLFSSKTLSSWDGHLKITSLYGKLLIMILHYLAVFPCLRNYVRGEILQFAVYSTIIVILDFIRHKNHLWLKKKYILLQIIYLTMFSTIMPYIKYM